MRIGREGAICEYTIVMQISPVRAMKLALIAASRRFCKFGALVPRTQRSAPPLRRRGALQSRGPAYFHRNRGPGSAKQREERCIAPGTRQPEDCQIITCFRSIPALVVIDTKRRSAGGNCDACTGLHYSLHRGDPDRSAGVGRGSLRSRPPRLYGVSQLGRHPHRLRVRVNRAVQARHHRWFVRDLLQQPVLRRATPGGGYGAATRTGAACQTSEVGEVSKVGEIAAITAVTATCAIAAALSALVPRTQRSA
jgi:hypothetical protein